MNNEKPVQAVAKGLTEEELSEEESNGKGDYWDPSYNIKGGSNLKQRRKLSCASFANATSTMTISCGTILVLHVLPASCSGSFPIFPLFTINCSYLHSHFPLLFIFCSNLPKHCCQAIHFPHITQIFFQLKHSLKRRNVSVSKINASLSKFHFCTFPAVS